MNRRSFFSTLAKGTAGFFVLPSALTYARRWKPTAAGVLIPEYTGVPIEFSPSILSATVRELFEAYKAESIRQMLKNDSHNFSEPTIEPSDAHS